MRAATTTLMWPVRNRSAWIGRLYPGMLRARYSQSLSRFATFLTSGCDHTTFVRLRDVHTRARDLRAYPSFRFRASAR